MGGYPCFIKWLAQGCHIYSNYIVTMKGGGVVQVQEAIANIEATCNPISLLQ